jgi:para-aminobenzoate synthetase component I
MSMIQNYINELNNLGKNKIPFLFIIDFEHKKPLVFPLHQIPDDISFDIPGFSNCKAAESFNKQKVKIKKIPISFGQYSEAFLEVKKNLDFGNTYLLNLTAASKIESSLSLEDIFKFSDAKFRLKFKDEFICFSPEIFVRIKNGIISSYPMKGTIDARIDHAADKILQSKKEFSEHNTIVDLIRNDLSIIAKKVRVKKFRYIDKIVTHESELLQVSSEITGELSKNYYEHIGDLLFKLLPAGSISGAPKQKTLEIIKNAEFDERGYYTGVFGIFDGQALESAVMIRYIEKKKDQLIYRSGGGITALSEAEDEYQELIDKVYVPII